MSSDVGYTRKKGNSLHRIIPVTSVVGYAQKKEDHYTVGTIPLSTIKNKWSLLRQPEGTGPEQFKPGRRLFLQIWKKKEDVGRGTGKKKGPRDGRI